MAWNVRKLGRETDFVRLILSGQKSRPGEKAPQVTRDPALSVFLLSDPQVASLLSMATWSQAAAGAPTIKTPKSEQQEEGKGGRAKCARL